MFVTSQSGDISIRSDLIKWFSLDETHNVSVYCRENNSNPIKMLVGTYKTSSKAIDAMIEVVDAIEAGKNYRMPADD